MSLGKPSCPLCRGLGWMAGEPRVMEANGGKRMEFPTVAPCTCRGGAPKPQPLVSAEMKLDAQQRAAGEIE